jgi:hypothetical protein
MEVSGQFHAPTALLSGKKLPGTCWTGSWVGYAESLARVWNPTPAVQPVARRYTDWAIMSLMTQII